MVAKKLIDKQAYLKDIELSIAEINEFLPEERNFYAFQKDLKITDSRKIVDTRNRIIHGYDSVSEDVIWLIVNRYLPILEKEIKMYL